ncbi:hypothetical protein GPECTOR_16g705 [Gonium pectorale]|uniref:Uncharacterized protein n=1 Tax=Gonium pectorale TaxID=33097 RepID=A0A150GMH1_GONPE|nr:hypothetical protein GPECTOR_16g705 [Gonium pectorale]|eukprot:KXZ50530.1 hypothetical protein GPECTOR_16g705 [Gonium pectorale]
MAPSKAKPPAQPVPLEAAAANMAPVEAASASDPGREKTDNDLGPEPLRISAEEGEVGSEQEREEAMPAQAVAEAADTLADKMVTLGTGTQR